jgi:hypothetical protein
VGVVQDGLPTDVARRLIGADDLPMTAAKCFVPLHFFFGVFFRVLGLFLP